MSDSRKDGIPDPFAPISEAEIRQFRAELDTDDRFVHNQPVFRLGLEAIERAHQDGQFFQGNISPEQAAHLEELLEQHGNTEK